MTEVPNSKLPRNEQQREIVVLLAEDDDGHATLIRRNLERAGIRNRICRFRDGQEVLDFLFRRGPQPHRSEGLHYLLLDIRMPRVDGIDVLRQVKADPELRKLPVIMITTTDDPREVETCHALGCSSYITKPVAYESFVEAIHRLGLFLLVVQIPTLNGPGAQP